MFLYKERVNEKFLLIDNKEKFSRIDRSDGLRGGKQLFIVFIIERNIDYIFYELDGNSYLIYSNDYFKWFY